jgi:hypothetical protein
MAMLSNAHPSDTDRRSLEIKKKSNDPTKNYSGFKRSPVMQITDHKIIASLNHVQFYGSYSLFSHFCGLDAFWVKACIARQLGL